MQPYTLWVLSAPSGREVLLVTESSDGALGRPRVARNETDLKSFLAAHGMPAQISANVSTAVRFVREAEVRLFQVPATVLKPKELVGPLVTLVLRAQWR